jgi:hypothetical protein
MSLRLDIAENLEQLNARHRAAAETLRFSERLEFGEPVPAYDVDQMVEDAVREAEANNQGEIEDLNDSLDDANHEIERLRKLVEPDALASYDERQAGKSKA